MDALREVERWPAENVAVGVTDAAETIATAGPARQAFSWASVTKLATALAALVAVEEGVLDLDDAAGPPGATIRHLLAHAPGLPPDDVTPIAEPGRRRIYSNAGFELLADELSQRAETAFADYLAAAVLRPLVLEAALTGSPASGVRGSLDDLLRLARELLAPTVVGSETLAAATEVVFRGLVGVLPGFGRMDPNDWGLGFELRDAKSPHWTGTLNSPRTFGHFGRSGTFLWIDPDAGLALACLTDREFGQWAKEAWPRLADAVLAEAAGARGAA